MIVTPFELLIGSIYLFGSALCVLGYASYRKWDEPGSTMFGVFVASWGILAFTSTVFGAFGLEVELGALWVLTMVPWCLFTLQYTGREFDWPTIGVLAVPALGLVPWTVTVRGPLFEVLGILIFAYYSALGTAGAVLILWAANRYGNLSLTDGLLLAVAGFTPVATSNAFGILSEQFGVTILLVVFSFGLFSACVVTSVALFWRDVFDSTPAAGTIGQRAIARETDDLILIADDDGETIMRNETANRRLPSSEQAAVGRSIERSLGMGVDTLRSRDTAEIQTDQGVRQFDPEVTTLTDQHGRKIGTMVSLRDVTDREIRRQRLEVLNRVVGHNLRNRASVIKARTEVVADEIDDGELQSHLDTATDSVDSLTDLGEKARTIEALLGRNGTDERPMELEPFLDGVVAECTDEWSEASITIEETPSGTIRSDPEILRFVLRNVVEDALERADSGKVSVELRVIVDDSERYPLTIVVTDDGPGIPEREIEVIEAGTERPLKHGRGIGLWVTSWAVRELGGSLSFPDRESPISTVLVQLPNTLQRRESSAESPSVGR